MRKVTDVLLQVHEKETNDSVSEQSRRRMKRILREHRDETEQLKKRMERETEELIARSTIKYLGYCIAALIFVFAQGHRGLGAFASAC